MRFKPYGAVTLVFVQFVAWQACSRQSSAPSSEAVLAKFAPAQKQNPYRPLPMLSPSREKANAGILSVEIAMGRFGHSAGASAKPRPLRIGNYLVADVPVYQITPTAGTTVSVIDPDTGNSVSVSLSTLTDPDWIFGGTHWQLTQGDTLRVKLTSVLDFNLKDPNGLPSLPANGGVPCNTTNLHTHGLLVPPTHPDPGATVQLYGDYVLDVTQNKPPQASGTDECGEQMMAHHPVVPDHMQYEIKIPGEPGETGVGSGQHPSGLFWYHPHPHGFSRMQTGGGTTGLITIGDMKDYVCKQGFANRECPSTSALSHPRYLELKDAQITPGDTGAVHTLLKDYGANDCKAGNGECIFSDGSGIWVFTINGVQYPTLPDVKSDEGEVWRIANTSANATYLLELRSADGSKKKPFQILAVDGVSVDQPAPQGAERSSQLLLMPGSRAEVWVTPEPGQKYTLYTAATATGNDGSGDSWPEVALAEVQWRAATPSSTAPAGTVFVQGPLESRVLPQQVRAPAPAPTVASAKMTVSCIFDDRQDERHIYMVKSHVPANADGKEVFGLIAGVRHKNKTEDFFNGSQTLHSLNDVWNAVLQNDTSNPTAPAPAYGSDLPLYNICTMQGRVETWVVENWTDEDHNFHVHQTRFKLDATAAHLTPNNIANYYQNPKAVLTGGVGTMDALLRNLVPVAGNTSVQRTAYHDSVPVPRGEGDSCDGTPNKPGCTPGRISIHIGFKRDEQVGHFVYHCHILEHEDGGMMGEIQVCQAGDSRCLAAPFPQTHQHDTSGH